MDTIKLDIVSDLMSSSSSSSSSSSNYDEVFFSSGEDQDQYFHLLQDMGHREKKHRVQNFVEDVVKNYSEDEFRSNFRVSRATKNILTTKFKNSNHFKFKLFGGRICISAETQCLVFLWFVGNKNSYREVANLFNISFSSVHRILSKYLEFLFQISTEYIKFPTTDVQKKETAEAFEKLSGFPNVLGCIDGCYIYIRKPAHKTRSTYVNRHGLISITLQGICDAEKKFIDVFVGSPSKIHDSRIFHLSYISKEIPQICGQQYHILGDSAYPSREYLLTPYKDYGNLNDIKRKYNKKHCQTRVKIENTFGLLKQRFRQLIRLDFFTVERMCKVVLGCCVLHNLCIQEADLWLEEDLPDRDTDFEELQNESVAEAALKHLGELKRNRLAEIF